METVHFLNLSNGPELLDLVPPGERVEFIRIQSTWCEQKRWADLLAGISDSFLLHLAMGHECVVYDAGSRTECPRAIWQGLTWIHWAACRSWSADGFRAPTDRAQSATTAFEGVWRSLPRQPVTRLKWFRRFLPDAPTARLRSVWRWAEHDGKADECVARVQAAMHRI